MARTPTLYAFTCLLALFATSQTALASGSNPGAQTTLPHDSLTGHPQPRLSIQRFAFIGNTIFDNEELEVLLLHYLEKPITLNDLYLAADELTNFYRSHGYGLASVTVPPQDVTEGRVTLEIIEGRISKVSVADNDNYNFRTLERYLHHTVPGNVFSAQALEDELQRLNELPGLDARVVISPGQAYGHSDIEFRLMEEPWEAGVTVDNFGRDAIGRHRLDANLAVNNPFNIGDRLALSLLVSEESLLRAGNLEYAIPITTRNDWLTFAINRASYEADAAFAALGVLGESNFSRVGYTRPLLQTDTTRLTLNAGASRFESYNEITGLPLPPSESDLDLLEIGVGLRHESADGFFFATNATLSGNGSHNDSSLFERDADSQYGRLAVTVNVVQPLCGRWWLAGNLASAYSREPLPDSQQFSIGGPTSLRAYEAAAARGDAGYALALEIHRQIGTPDFPGSMSLQLDRGRVFRRLFVGEADISIRDAELTGAGLGLQFGAAEGFRLTISAHRPIGDPPAHLGLEKSSRYWASLGYRF